MHRPNETGELLVSAARQPVLSHRLRRTAVLVSLPLIAIPIVVVAWLAHSWLIPVTAQPPPASGQNYSAAGAMPLNLTPLALLFSQPQPTPTPWPTPIQDLSLLVRQADTIVEATVPRSNGAMHSIMNYLKIDKWLKKPGGVVTTTGVLWVGEPYEFFPSYGFNWMGSGDGQRFVLFMISRQYGDGLQDYQLAGGTYTTYNSGFFPISGGRITSAGISSYDGWAVAEFERKVFDLELCP